MVPYANSLSFNRTVQAVQSQTKFNNFEVLDKHKMVPKHKVRMAIPLCQMISMPIVRFALKIDNLKMGHAI